MGVQHLGVVHNLAFVRGDLQRSQNIIHSGNAGGCASWGAVEAPLEDVEARPTCYVGTLNKQEAVRIGSAALMQQLQVWKQTVQTSIIQSLTCMLSPSLQVSARSTML